MSFLNLLRNQATQTVVSLAITLQALNICIDPIDHHAGLQDISINEIESCVEFFVEVILNEEHAISETDETDYSTSFRIATIVLFLPTLPQINTGAGYTLMPAQGIAYLSARFNSLSLPIVSPPPRSLS